MGYRIAAIVKKVFSLSLILNSLITLACIAQILFNHYPDFPNWQPYSPYLINGSIMFLVIPAAVLNIYLGSRIGRNMHTGRLFFHHYVYGFFVILFSVIFAFTLTSVSLPVLFLVYTSDLAVNFGRFLILGGFALLLDDLPDVSLRVGYALKRLEFRAYQWRKVLHCLLLLSGLVSLYVFIAVTLWTTQNLNLIIPATVMIGSFMVTGFNSLIYVKRKELLKKKTGIEKQLENRKRCLSKSYCHNGL